MSGVESVNGVLLLYNRPALFRDAATITDHIAAFGRSSRFPVQAVNTDGGFPKTLAGQRYEAIVLHYTLFASGPHPYLISAPFLDYLSQSTDSYKVAFFQDEHEYCRRRFRFLDEFGVDCVYTCFSPEYFEPTYGTHTKVERLVSHVPAYVSPDMVETANALHVADGERRVDVGYRTRPTPPYFGRGGIEKVEIAERFVGPASAAGLSLDISSREEDRLYGEGWYRFLAGSRCQLGTESGASCVDVEDEVREEYLRLVADGKDPTIEDLEAGALGRWDGVVQLRTTSSRHFEAAAMRVVQLMYEGDYSGVLLPMEHYIPLRKDFANLDEAIERFKDPGLRHDLTENAYRDLIASGEHSDERFIAGFDAVLADAGLAPGAAGPALPAVSGRPLAGRAKRLLEGVSLWLRHRAPRTWNVIWRVSRPPMNAIRGIRRG